jgi:hypothetical protein
LGVGLFLVGNAYAAVVSPSYTGPIYLNPGYQFTANVTSLTTPHQFVGLSYSVNNGAALCSNCTCTSPDCNPATGVGNWACSIPTSYNSATIVWNISAYPNASCGGNQALMHSGSFTTAPTVIQLRTLAARLNAVNFQADWLTLTGAGLAVLCAVGVIWLRRRVD